MSMSRLGRRGFLQLVGLGATGSLASVPLFGTTEAIAAPPSLLAGHLVIGGGFAEGTVRLVLGDGTPDDFVLRSGQQRTPTSPLNGEDARVVLDTKFGSGLVRLKLPDAPLQRVAREYALMPDEDPAAVAYVQARSLRREIRDKAIRTLAASPGSLGQTIVTVVHQPLRWFTRGTLTAQFDQWLVNGIIHSDEIFSEMGEYPLAEELGVDVDRLVWIDRKMILGEIPDELRKPSLLDQLRL